MAATDGSPDRLADARDRADELRDELPDGGVASIVVAGDAARVALTASADDAEFERALRTIDGTEGRADFADAFALAESLETGTTPIGFVLLTDGGLDDAEEAALLPPGTRDRADRPRRHQPGITRLVRRAARRRPARPGDGAQHRRPGGRPRPCASTSTASRRRRPEVTLGAGEQRDVELDVPDGDRVEAFLEGDDLLAADDHAVAVVGRPARRSTCSLVGDALFWGEAAGGDARA